MSAKALPRVLQVVLALEPGGTERLVIELVRRLHRRFPMAVCCLDAPGAWASELTDLGVSVTALQRTPGFQPGLSWQLARAARDIGATVLHCHHYSPFVYGRLAAVAARTRVVFTEHGRLSDAPPSPKRRLATRWLVAGVGAMFAVSHDLRQHMVAEGFPERLGVIWNGIEPGPAPTSALRERARAAIGLPPDARIVGTVARLDPVKDLTTLLDAHARLQRRGVTSHLVMIGDGPELERLKSRVHELGVDATVRLLGRRDDARDLMLGFDVYVNTSISEGMSLTLLEAMAAELPVVATGVGGTPEVVAAGETGLLCAARSPESVSDALATMLDDRARARVFGIAGRHRVMASFTLDRMVERYATIYEQGA